MPGLTKKQDVTNFELKPWNSGLAPHVRVKAWRKPNEDRPNRKVRRERKWLLDLGAFEASCRALGELWAE